MSDARAQDGRFGRLVERRDGADFPFYNGVPVAVSAAKWGGLLLSLVVAFVAVSLWPLDSWWGVVLAQVVFLAIPLGALVLLIPGHWTALFRHFAARDLLVVLAFWLLAFVTQIAVGEALGVIDKSSAADPATMAGDSGVQVAAHFIGAIPQLLGEELLAIIPFLAVLWLGCSRFGWSRKSSVVVALVISSLIFGAVHLPTYDWNVLQAVVGIGLVRVALTLAYIRTKNLWVSFGAHLLTDWVVFFTALQ